MNSASYHRALDIMDVISARTRQRIRRVGDDDPVSQDILIAGTDELEKAAWMLRAQSA